MFKVQAGNHSFRKKNVATDRKYLPRNIGLKF